MDNEIVFVTHNIGKIKSAEKYCSYSALEKFAKWYEKNS